MKAAFKRISPNILAYIQIAAGEKSGAPVTNSERRPPAGQFGGIFNNRTVGELDWAGNIVWEWGEQAPGGLARQSHDWARLPNGNTIIVSTVNRVVSSLSVKPIADQALYEVTSFGCGMLPIISENTDFLRKD